jgi:hypothetical protein
MRAKLENKTKQHKVWWNNEIKNNKILTKEPRKKVKNKKNKDGIEKNNIWQIAI